MITIALWILAGILVFTGIAGIMLPVIPGPPLVFCGFLIAAWIDNFQKVGWITLTVLGILTILSIVVDFLAAGFGAKRTGANRKAVVGALIGTFIGIFFGIPGLILGPFLGAIVGEYLSQQDLMKASKVGLGAWIGFVFGTAVKLGLAFAMLGIFITAFIL